MSPPPSSALPIHLNPDHAVPAYRQVADQVRFLAASGAIRAGDQLPSFSELARQLRVSASTIVRAYDDLAAAGIVVQRPGAGVFLAETAPRGASSAARIDAPLRRRARDLVASARAAGLSDDLIRTLIDEALHDG